MSSKRNKNSLTSLIIQKASVATAADDALRQFAAAGVLLPQPSAVRDYLMRHSDLVDIMLRAVRAAREKIGGQTQLSLEIYRDPEVDDLYPALYVRQDEYAEDIFDLIEDARSGYEPELAGKTGWFLVTTDLCPPR